MMNINDSDASNKLKGAPWPDHNDAVSGSDYIDDDIEENTPIQRTVCNVDKTLDKLKLKLDIELGPASDSALCAALSKDFVNRLAKLNKMDVDINLHHENIWNLLGKPRKTKYVISLIDKLATGRFHLAQSTLAKWRFYSALGQLGSIIVKSFGIEPVRLTEEEESVLPNIILANKNETVASEIERLMIENGFNHERELAEALGVDPITLYRWKRRSTGLKSLQKHFNKYAQKKKESLSKSIFFDMPESYNWHPDANLQYLTQLKKMANPHRNLEQRLTPLLPRFNIALNEMQYIETQINTIKNELKLKSLQMPDDTMSPAIRKGDIVWHQSFSEQERQLHHFQNNDLVVVESTYQTVTTVRLFYKPQSLLNATEIYFNTFNAPEAEEEPDYRIIGPVIFTEPQDRH